MHRMNTKSKDKPRPIIAKFSNYNAKSKLYKATLNLRNTDLKDVGAEKIFINGEPSFSKRREKWKKIYRNGKTWTVDGKMF